MARQCPDCQIELRTENLLGIDLDVCPDCAGIYFDDGEMMNLKDLGDDAFSELDDMVLPDDDVDLEEEIGTSKRMCPGCKEVMHEYNYLYTSKVRLDACPDCGGTWVEHGELTAMQQALADAKNQPINESLMRRLVHERVVAEEMAKHEERIARQKHRTRVLRVLTLRRSGML